MSRTGRDDEKLVDLDELIRKIIDDAHGDDEQLWACRQAFAAAEEAMPRAEGPSGEDDDDDDRPY